MIKTLKQLRDEFWLNHPCYVLHFRAKKRQNDYNTDIRCAWCDYVDYLEREGRITEKLANRATL